MAKFVARQNLGPLENSTSHKYVEHQSLNSAWNDHMDAAFCCERCYYVCKWEAEDTINSYGPRLWRNLQSDEMNGSPSEVSLPWRHSSGGWHILNTGATGHNGGSGGSRHHWWRGIGSRNWRYKSRRRNSFDRHLWLKEKELKFSLCPMTDWGLGEQGEKVRTLNLDVRFEPCEEPVFICAWSDAFWQRFWTEDCDCCDASFCVAMRFNRVFFIADSGPVMRSASATGWCRLPTRRTTWGRRRWSSPTFNNTKKRKEVERGLRPLISTTPLF